MQWDLKQISSVLNSNIETICVESQIQYMLWFSDNNLKFYLHIQPESETVMLAADPIDPMGMPFLEYSFNCNIIKIIDSPYDNNLKAIYFYEDKESCDGVRLAMNPRYENNWYLWCNT